MTNKGIIMSGGELNVQQLVVGDGAHITNYGKHEREMMLVRIENLLMQIQSADILPDHRKELLDAAVAVKKQASTAKPDKTLIEKSLSFIVNSAPSITAITTAVKAVVELVSAWTVA